VSGGVPVSARRARGAAASLAAAAGVAALIGVQGCSGGSTARTDAAASPSTGTPSGSAATAVRTVAPAPASATPTVTRPTAPAPPPAPAGLPRGGRTFFPRYRVVAYYGEGYPGGIGLIDVNHLDEAAAALQRQADAHAGYGRPVLPAFELIVTDATRRPGPDGSYSQKLDPAVVQRYLDVARAHQMLLVLDFQPGTDDFLSQVRRYEALLRQPDVGVGLDAEWRTPGGQHPYQGTGHSSAAEVNAVGNYLAGIVRAGKLPEKLMIVHQFRRDMLPDREAVAVPRGIAVSFHMDGLGGPGLKTSVYGALAVNPPFHNGYKIFPRLDTPPMTPDQAMALRPQPELITYQ